MKFHVQKENVMSSVNRQNEINPKKSHKVLRYLFIKLSSYIDHKADEFATVVHAMTLRSPFDKNILHKLLTVSKKFNVSLIMICEECFI